MELLILLVIFIILLILVEGYNRDDSRVIERLSHDAERVVPGITKKCTIVAGDSTYTENKNKIYILLRDPSGQYYNYDTLIYALLHEIAHVLTPELDHTKMFVDVYTDLLNKANKIGIYDPKKVNMSYCAKCVV